MRKLIYSIPVLALAACGSTAEPAGMPATVMPIAEIDRMEREAVDFAEQHIEAWPALGAFVDGYAEDVTFSDPTWSDHRTGRDTVVGMLKNWERFTDYTVDVTATYLSTTGAAFEQTWPGLQPPMALPPDPPVASGLEVYRFDDGNVAGLDIWYRAVDNEAYGIGCFAEDACPAFEDTVDRYLSAWSSRDADSVAALYGDDAVFTDSLLGLAAEGADTIGDLADVRFGSMGELTIEALDLYAWTDGQLPPTEHQPDRGGLTGVAIHYRATAEDDGTTQTQEGVTTLVLGTRDGAKIDADPDGLIHREDVFHGPVTVPVETSSGPDSGDAAEATTGTIEISFDEWAGVEGYRVLAGVFTGNGLEGGAFWTIIDSDPFSGRDVVHPPFTGDVESDAEAWGDDDYLWDETAQLEPRTYEIRIWANPGELDPYGSHIPAGSIERECSVDVEVVAGKVAEVVIADVPIGGEHCIVVDGA